MDELKNRTMEVIDNINKDWVESLKLAEEKGTGIDLSDMMGKFSANIKRLDTYFRDAQQRMRDKGGKSWWKG